MSGRKEPNFGPPKARTVQYYLDLLGYEVKDRVTKFEGVITSVGFDLYGCIQAIVNPKAEKSGSLGECHWFDINRLEITSKKPVMKQPDYQVYSQVIEGNKGPENKPIM